MKIKKFIRKTKIFGIILILFLVFILYMFFYEPQYDGPIKKGDKTLIISHRGFGNYAPDNSLAAVKIALENGLDGVDVDGQLTRDGEVVIFHDLSIDRLTNGSGKVKDKSLDEMKSLDLGLKFNESFKGSYVKSFEEFLETANGTAIYMIELKSSSIKNTGLERKVAEIIDKHNAHTWVYISSFNPLVLYRLEKIDSKINTVLIFMDTNWNEELLKEINPEDKVDIPFILRKEPFRRAIRKVIDPDALSVNFEVNENTIDKLLEKNYPIFLWTLDKEEDINFVLSKKPYGVITNEPLRGKRLRDEK